MSISAHLQRISWVLGEVYFLIVSPYSTSKGREKDIHYTLKQAKWDVSLYNLHLIVIHTAKRLNYYVKPLKKASMGVGTELWQLLSLDLRSPALRRSMSTDAEAEADRAQNKPVQKLTCKLFSHLFFFPPHNQKWLIHLSFSWELSVIDCRSLDFQGLTRRMREGTGMLSWPLESLINAVCTADLYHSAKEHWERLEHVVLSALIKPEKEGKHSSFILLEAMEEWFRWRKHCEQSSAMLWQSIPLLPPLLPISG